MFSDKIKPLNENITLPLPTEVVTSFEHLKKELENSVLVTPNLDIPLVVETDASDTALSATLNQDGRLVAFSSRTLSPSERNHSSVKKEAYAIVEAIRNVKHYLCTITFNWLQIRRQFPLSTTKRGMVMLKMTKSKGVHLNFHHIPMKLPIALGFKKQPLTLYIDVVLQIPKRNLRRLMNLYGIRRFSKIYSLCTFKELTFSV